MSIEVECPNGHQLRVKDKFSGKSGLCPHCKARVQVPDTLTDAGILDILGDPPPPAPPPPPIAPEEISDDSASIHHEEPKSATASDSVRESGTSLLGSSVIRHHKVCKGCGHTAVLWQASCTKCGKFFDQ